MTTRLNKHSCDFAQDRIKDGKVVHDERDDWSEHQPFDPPGKRIHRGQRLGRIRELAPRHR